jgi:hypothetical protein
MWLNSPSCDEDDEKREKHILDTTRWARLAYHMKRSSVQFVVNNGQFGRLYTSKHSVQNLPSRLRKAVAEDGYVVLYIDIDDMHPSAIALLSGDEHLQEVVRNGEYKEFLMDVTGMTRAAVKLKSLISMNGGGKKGAIRKVFAKEFPEAEAWLVETMRRGREGLAHHDGRIMPLRFLEDEEGKPTGFNADGHKAVAYVLQHFDGDMMKGVLGGFDSSVVPSLRPLLPVHDGLVLRCTAADLEASIEYVGKLFLDNLPESDLFSYTAEAGTSWGEVTKYTEGMVVEEKVKSSLAHYGKVTMLELDEDGYINHPDYTHKLTVLDVGMGYGKTYGTLDKLSDEKVLVHTPLVSVADEAANVGGIKSYRTLGKGELLSESGTVCINSLSTKIAPEMLRHHTAIWDECRAIRGNMTGSGTMTPVMSAKTYKAARKEMQNASRAIVMEAGVTTVDVDFYKRLMNITDADVDYRYLPVQDQRRFTHFSSYGPWKNSLMDDIEAGMNVHVGTLSKAEATKLEATIGVRFPHVKTLLITDATTKRGKVGELFRDPSRKSELYDGVQVLISTPTMTSGYSINADVWHMDRMYLYGCSHSAGVEGASQMTRRVRNNTSNEVYSYASGGGDDVFEATKEGVITYRKGLMAMFKTLREEHGLELLPFANPGSLYYDEHVAIVKSEEHLLGRGTYNFSRPWRAFLEGLDVAEEVVWLEAETDEEKAVRLAGDVASIRGIEAAVKQARAQSILDAPVISLEEARGMKNPFDVSLDSKQRAEIVGMVGEEGLTIREALRYNASKDYWGGSRRLRGLLAGKEGMESAINRDLLSISDGASDIEIKHSALTLDLAIYIVEAYGAENPLEDSFCNHAEARTVYRELADDETVVKAAYSQFGIVIRKSSKNPYQPLTQIMKKGFGLKMSQRRVGERGAQVREHFLATDEKERAKLIQEIRYTPKTVRTAILPFRR